MTNTGAIQPICQSDGRIRVVVGNLQPAVDGGRFPIRRIVGDSVVVETDCFADGHDVVACFGVMALAHVGRRDEARRELEALARTNALDGWRFIEWFHGRTPAPMDMAGQNWNAVSYLLALRMLHAGLTA